LHCVENPAFKIKNDRPLKTVCKLDFFSSFFLFVNLISFNQHRFL